MSNYYYYFFVLLLHNSDLEEELLEEDWLSSKKVNLFKCTLYCIVVNVCVRV